jgi:hypothetical protein
MKAGAIVLFVLSAITAFVATKNVFLGGQHRPPGGELVVSYAVGSFLVPMVLLIVGLVLWKKGQTRKVADDPPKGDQGS